MAKRTLFIGDVHGCYDELIALCEKMQLREEDTLYFVWDLINKWPKSFEVVEFVHNRPNTWSVIGNHEFLEMCEESDIHIQDANIKKFWQPALLRNKRDRYKELRELLEVHWYRKWLTSLPAILEKENFIVVHGGIHPDYGLDTPTEIATEIRLAYWKPWHESYHWEKLVIYGHWAAQWLRVTHNTIGLDTGCCFGGHLTAYCLETKEFWQVRANQVYTLPFHWGKWADA